MSTADKEALKSAIAKDGLKAATLRTAVIDGGQALLTNPSSLTLGRLPPGVFVAVNSSRVARFPIPLTVGASIGVAVGAIAMMRGHRVVGFLVLALSGAGLGAAAAAPELNAALAKMRGTV